MKYAMFHRRRPLAHPHKNPRFPPRMRAFSLIELLVVLGVVAVVVSIVISFLSAARGTQRRLTCLANCNTCTKAIMLYAGDSRDAFPYLASHARLEDAFEVGSLTLPYRAQAFHWPRVGGLYLGEPALGPAARCPSTWARMSDRSRAAPVSADDVASTDYWLSYALFTRPELWENPRADPPVGLGGAFLYDVQHPSAKCMLVEIIPWHTQTSAIQRDPWTESVFYAPPTGSAAFVLSLVDGSAAVRPIRDLAPPAATPTGWAAAPALCTPGGSRGRDLR